MITNLALLVGLAGSTSPIHSFICNNDQGFHLYANLAPPEAPGRDKAAELYFRKDGALLAEMHPEVTYVPFSDETPYYSWEFQEVGKNYHAMITSPDLKSATVVMKDTTEAANVVTMTCELVPEAAVQN